MLHSSVLLIRVPWHVPCSVTFEGLDLHDSLDHAVCLSGFNMSVNNKVVDKVEYCI